jgi:hypothetical protein
MSSYYYKFVSVSQKDKAYGLAPAPEAFARWQCERKLQVPPTLLALLVQKYKY